MEYTRVCLHSSVDVTAADLCRYLAERWIDVGAGDAFRGVRFFFQAEDGTRHIGVTGVQTCALPIYRACPWEHTAFWFFAHTALPPGPRFSLRGDGPDQPPRNTVLHATDGSWCEIREDPDDTEGTP